MDQDIGIAQLFGPAQSPEHSDGTHRIVLGTFDIHRAIADHPAVVTRGVQPVHRFANDVVLVGSLPVWHGTDDLMEAVAERKLEHQPSRVIFVLSRGNAYAMASSM
jgi:hypothetical protein